MSELSFVVPPDHETLDFKLLLKPKNRNTACIVEEGQNGLLTGGSLQGDARLALFRLEGDVIVEFRVFIKADRVSPFDLATSWKAYRENLQPSTVWGIPDVSINPDTKSLEVSPSKSHMYGRQTSGRTLISQNEGEEVVSGRALITQKNITFLRWFGWRMYLGFNCLS